MASFNIDWSKGSSQSITITENVDFSFSNPVLGNSYFLQVKLNGPYSSSWPEAVIWSDDIDPVQTAALNKMDVFKFVFDGVCYHGKVFGLNYTVP